jgi:hypothetical protein
MGNEGPKKPIRTKRYKMRRNALIGTVLAGTYTLSRIFGSDPGKEYNGSILSEHDDDCSLEHMLFLGKNPCPSDFDTKIDPDYRPPPFPTRSEMSSVEVGELIVGTALVLLAVATWRAKRSKQTVIA